MRERHKFPWSEDAKEEIEKSKRENESVSWERGVEVTVRNPSTITLTNTDMQER
jgi:hypothetical protein